MSFKPNMYKNRKRKKDMLQNHQVARNTCYTRNQMFMAKIWS